MTWSNRVLFFAFLGAALLSTRPAEAQWVYATSPDANLVSVIDPFHDTVANTIPTPFSPGAIAITPDGTLAYVVNKCSQADRTSGVPGSVTVLDLVKNVVVQSLSVGNCPTAVAVGTTPNGVRAYVSNSPGSISVIDVATNTVLPSIPTTGPANDLALSPDGTTLYVLSSPSNLSINTANSAIGQVGTALGGIGYVAYDSSDRAWLTGGSGVTAGNNPTYFVDCTSGPVAFAPARAFILDIECGVIYDATATGIVNTFSINNFDFTDPLLGDAPNRIAISSDGSRGYAGGRFIAGSFQSASATAVMGGSSVAGVNITSPGSGYLGAPTVQFLSQDVDAIGFTQQGNGPGNPLGSVPWVIIDNPGSGYLRPPVVQFVCTDSSGQCASVHSAAATATITNGSVSSVTVTNPGSGYINAPEVLFIRQFTAAQGIATVSNGGVVSVTLTNPGFGYSQPPRVAFVCGLPPAACGAGVAVFDPSNDTQITTIPLVGADAQGLAIGPTPAPNTPVSNPAGAAVPVTLTNAPIAVTFESGITQAGFTGAAISTTGPSLQPNFQLSNPAVYYDIFTTAIYPVGSTIHICITAQGVTLNSTLAHFVGGTWVPMANQTVTGTMICGDTSSLSPFAIEEPATPALLPTTIGLSVSPNPAQAGQTVTFTSAVSASGGTGTGAPNPTGSVTFFDGTTALGPAVNFPNSGPAVFMTSTLSAGTHTITAQYSGDSNFASSSSGAVTLTVNLNTASIGLAISPSPAAAGQTVTFSSGVSAGVTGNGVPAPTGSVTFLDGTTVLGPAVNLPTTGLAVFTTSTLSAGMHSITAVYSGDPNYSSTNSNAVSLTVSKSASSVGLAISPSPAAAGQTVTFTSGVIGFAPAGTGTGGGVPAPTGSVTFFDGTTALGPAVNLPNSGPAVFTTSALTPGAHSITAQYSGDANYLASTSSAVMLTVTNPATTTALSVSPTPSTYGQAVTLTATVNSPAGTPTGAVNFFDGTNPLGPGSLSSSGIATLTTSLLSAGTHSLTASYPATGNFLASTSSAVAQTVNPAPLVITANNASRRYGQLNPQFTGNIAGLQNGDAITAAFNSAATPASPVGTYSITASLADPSGKLPNYSVTMNNGTLTVTAAPLTVAAANAQRVYGAANPVFTGTITGIQNGDNITASYSTAATPASPVGVYAIVPVLLDPGAKLGNYTVTLTNGTLTVIQASTTTGLSLTPNPSTFGQAVTLTATVAPVAPGAGTPTGTVTFRDGSVTLGTGTLSSADTAALTISSLSAGSHTLTASYRGDPSFTASASSAVSDQVLCGVLISLSPSSVPVGGITTVTGKVISCSTTTETVAIKFTWSGPSQPNSCSSTKSEVFTTPPFPLAPNTSQTISFPFKVPGSACPGTYSITSETLVNGVAVDTSTASLTVTSH